MGAMDFGCANGALTTGIRAANEFMTDMPELKNTQSHGQSTLALVFELVGGFAFLLLLVLCIWKRKGRNEG